MSCTNCGDSQSCGGGSGCGSCADSCNSCNGPKTIITKRGLSGTPGTTGTPGRGYDATSSISTDILDTPATGMGGLITVEKAYTPGARVRFSDTANPSVNYFEGIVATYDPLTGAMVVSDVDIKAGSGTISAWDVNLAGEPGVDGITPDPATDRYGYTTSSVSSLVLGSFGVPGTNNITVDPYKSYVVGDVVRVLEPTGNYVETVIASYDPVTGVLGLDKNPSIGFKRFGTGTFTSWVITLISKEQIFAQYEYSLIYSARREFTDAGTNYVPIDGEDNSIATGTLLSFDSSDPDVTIISKVNNNGITTFPDDSTNFSDMVGSNIKFIEVDLFLPMTNVGEDLAGDRWMTARTIDAQQVVESGSIQLIKNAFNPTAGVSHGNSSIYYETHKVSVNKNTKTIAITWRIPYPSDQAQAAGPTNPFRFNFQIQNNTDINIFGGDYAQTGVNLTRQYALRIYI